MKPMAFETVEVSGLPKFEDDPGYVFEQKMDGTRAVIRVSCTGMEALSRSGNALKHTAATQHLPAIYQALSTIPVSHEEVVYLDGEIMIEDGMFYVFDAPMVALGSMRVTPEDPYWKRRNVLNNLLPSLGPTVKLVEQWASAPFKRQLVEGVREQGGEGIMVKDMNAPYAMGKRVRHSFKAKFVKSVDVVVTGLHRPDDKHGNIEFALTGSDAQFHKLGSCSAIGKSDVEPGDVIEVQYLAYTPGGGLREPRMVAVRQDKSPGECTWDQLETYSKRAVGEQ